MCSSIGNRQNNSNSSISNDTMFFVGKHTYSYSRFSFDTSFQDTIFIIQPREDSIVFYIKDILSYNPFKNELLLNRHPFRIKRADFPDNKFTYINYSSIDTFTTRIQLEKTSIQNNEKLNFDKIHYNKYMSFENGSSVQNSDFVGHVIKK